MICNLLGVLFKLLLSPSIVYFLYLFRKSFGATLVKRVRKAGSDFMNKVPRVSTQVMRNGKVLIFMVAPFINNIKYFIVQLMHSII